MSDWLQWSYALNSIVFFALGLGTGPGIQQLRRAWRRKRAKTR